MRLDASIVIDRPVGDVWRFYAVNLGADIPWLEKSGDSQFISGQIQGGSWGANPTRGAAKVLGSTDEQFK